MKKSFALAIIIILIFSFSIFAGKIEHKTELVKINSAKKVSLNCDLGAGEFRIFPSDISDVANIDIFYDPDQIKYYVESEIKGNTCYIDLESEIRRKSNIDTDENKWDIELSTEYPMEINLDIGACDADFDLGGIPLEEFTLDIGAASGNISFSEPNPIRMDELEIDAGASSITMDMIGNANFERFSFSGGAGSFELDFRGEYKGSATISIDIGLGSGDIVLPKGIPVRIETDGSNWLSSVDIHNDDLIEVDDDILESEDYDTAKIKLTIELSVGLGSLDVRFRK